ncbi:adhesion G-protein coupled receptor G2-like [Scyliorhinus canicula]|uniref:adhesion G-protein coupled receptor G2-like n=1 Tax=Scyliorhinus canicula TaxID=7830 RepID=UPI0018F28A76|nr:adhesion G-protein coupled receptor G2-like [Scyliorhinus canicula]
MENCTYQDVTTEEHKKLQIRDTYVAGVRSNYVRQRLPENGATNLQGTESTTRVSSSTGPNESCNYLFDRFKNNENEQCLDSVKTANELIQRCTDHIPNIASISTILENRLKHGDPEVEMQVAETEEIAFYLKKINHENFAGIQFPNVDTENISISELRIKLPSTLVDNVNINKYNTTALRIIFLIFKNTQLFQDQNQSTILNNVVGIQVGNLSIDNLTDPVTIEFNKSLSGKSIPKCVFWEVEQYGNTARGHWNDSGCTTENTDHQVICRCYHLTFFAVLLQLDRSQPLDEKILKSLTYITQIGCGLSAIFTAITLIIHFLLRRLSPFRERQKDVSIQIHINLSAALFLLNVTFLSNTWLSSSSTDGLCKVMAVLLHYSLICSFTWMGFEAFHLYIMLVRVFNTYIKCYLLKLCLAGWGIPAGVIFIIIGINTNFYGRHLIPVNGNYNSTNMCWITNNIVHYVTNVAYFILVFLGNTTMLIVVCVKVVRLKGGDKKSIFTVLGLTCLLGITYGIAFFSYGPQSVPVLYLFCILNPLQGFFIFLWYCMLIRSSSNTASETSKSSRSTTN